MHQPAVYEQIDARNVGGSFGYQEDASGLKLLGHRYYDPDTGRFLTPDPIGSGRNWYAYTGNNPVSKVDPRGLDDDEIIVTIVLGERSDGLVFYDDNIEQYWIKKLKKLYPGTKIVIRRVVHPSKKRFEKALDESDVVIFIGHGYDGQIMLKKGVSWGGLDAYMYGFSRKGKRRTKRLILATCYAMGHQTDWSYVSEKVWGATGNCSYSDLYHGRGGKWYEYADVPKDAISGRGRKVVVGIGGGGLRS